MMPRDEPTKKTTFSVPIKPPPPPFDGWLARKLARGAGTIPRPARVTEFYHGDIGGFARIVLAAEPSGEFAYRSRVEWPKVPEEHEAAILSAILDEIIAKDPGVLITKVRFTLQEVSWNEATSSPHIYYLAARLATSRLLSITESYEDLLEPLEGFTQRPLMWTGSTEFAQVMAFINGYLHGMGMIDRDFPGRDFSYWLAPKFDQSANLAWWSIIKKVYPHDEDALANVMPLMREFLRTRYPLSRRKQGGSAPSTTTPNPPFDGWLARKLAQGGGSIPSPARVTEYLVRDAPRPGDVGLRPDSEFGRITLAAEPSDAFTYHSCTEWPRDPQEYDTAVLDAILDEIVACYLEPVVTKVRFTLEEIKWDKANVSPHAYYLAARRATRRLLSTTETHTEVLSALEFCCKHPMMVAYAHSQEFAAMIPFVNGYLHGISRYGPYQVLLSSDFSSWLASKFHRSAHFVWWETIQDVFPLDEDALKNVVPLMREFLLTRYPPSQGKQDG